MKCWLVKRVLPLTTPLITATGPITERTVWALAIDDGLGHTGLGEAAPLPDFGSEAPEACLGALRTALGVLKADFISRWLDRGRCDAPLGQMEKLLTGAPCARQAIEGALLDLLAQQQGKPLASLLAEGLGTAPAVRLPVNALLSGPLDVVTESARLLAKAGFGCFKLKLSGEMGQDLERIYSVRAAIGTEAKLRVDANASWTLAQAQEFAVEAGDADLEYVEQPLIAHDLAGLAQLRRRTGLRIAVDEGVRVPGDVGRVAAAQAADVVVLKPMFLGGWRPTLQAQRLAASCGIGVVLTTAIDGAIGRAHATHYAAALGLTAHAQGLATGVLLTEDLTTAPLTVTSGFLTIGGAPGLGVGGLRP